VARFLLTAPPLAGHVIPLAAVAYELQARGHEVAWAVHERQVGRLLPADATVYGLDDERAGELLAAHTARLEEEAGRPDLTLTIWDDVFGPLALETLPGLEQAVDDFRPDALFVDEHALAGAFAARRAGLPWVTSSPSFQAVADTTSLDAVRRWLAARQAALQRTAGLVPVPSPGRSPQGVVVYTTRAFVGATSFPAECVFVGPAVVPRRQDLPFPWERLVRRPRVLVTLGTVVPAAGRRVYEAAVEAFGGTDVELVLCTPGDVAPPATPANVVAVEWAPFDTLLPQVDAVVCHAGVNTVNEALLHDLPLVVTPVAYDHAFTARTVVESGAGLAVRARRLRTSELRSAVEAVLGDPSFRAAATRIGASLRASDGAAGAADVLEAVALPVLGAA